MINSKAKGAEFELRMAKAFTQWWYGYPWSKSNVKPQFVRTKNIQCVDLSQRTVGGDIYPINGITTCTKFPLTIECKNDESWDLNNLLVGRTEQPLGKFYQQSTTDGQRFNKIPIVVFTKNHYPEFVLYDPLDMAVLKQLPPESQVIHNEVKLVIKGRLLSVVTLTTFFEMFGPKDADG